MFLYTFTKIIHMVKLSSELKAIFSSYNSINTIGDQLTITFTSELTTEELDVLNTLIVNHNPSELVSYADLVSYVQGKLLAAMNFGQNLMAEYGAMNTLRGLTVDQVKTLSAKLINLQQAIQSGSLYVALDIIEEIVTDELLSEADKTYFRNRIQAYLNIPLT